MIPREIVKKLRKIEIHTARLANDQLAGSYHSVFKGRGMAFSEVRQYQPGDDVRFIDWNVSARMRDTYVKIFTEEREMTVMLLVDLSASEQFGSVAQPKQETAAEVAALLAFSAIKNNDRVGLILFTDRIERFVPPKKGKAHVMRVVTEILSAKPEHRGTDVRSALELLGHVQKRKCVAFLISDFIAAGYEHALRVTSARHDLIPLQIVDPREEKLPDVGLMLAEDLETGELVEVDTSSRAVREAYAARVARQRAEREQLFRRLDLDHLTIYTHQPYVRPIAELFRLRQRRERRGMMRALAVTLCAVSCLAAATVQAAPKAKPGRVPPSAAGATPAEPAAAAAEAPAAEPPEKSLPAEHQPVLAMHVEPRDSVRTGELIQVEISAVAPLGDDVTIAEQPFSPYEVYKKQARVEAPKNATQRFVFKLELLAVEPGDKDIPAIELRVVTKDNFVGTAKTPAVPYKVRSRIANEPNAQPKLETKPRPVLEDNWLPIYVVGGLLGAGLIAGLTLLVARYLRNRKVAATPPPPPRPPWDIAVEKLADLRRQKQAMLDAGQGGLFVDQLSDVVRAYLGARYAFDGLETTTDEMLAQLKAHEVSLGFTHEVAQFLGRCDLVKFAKVEPDADEVDLLFAKAQDLVHFSEPERAAAHSGQGAPPPPPAGPGAPPPPPAGKSNGSSRPSNPRASAVKAKELP